MSYRRHSLAAFYGTMMASRFTAIYYFDHRNGLPLRQYRTMHGT